MAAWWLRGFWCGSPLVAERQERSWRVRSSPGLPSYTLAWCSRWCRLCTGAACQSWRLMEEFPVLRGRLVAQFALGIWCIISVSLYLAVIIPGVWVLLMSTRLGFLEMPFLVGAILGFTVDALRQYFVDYGRITHFFCVAVTSNPEEKCAQPMLLVACSLSAARTLESGHYSYEFSMSWCSWSPR